MREAAGWCFGLIVLAVVGVLQIIEWETAPVAKPTNHKCECQRYVENGHEPCCVTCGCAR